MPAVLFQVADGLYRVANYPVTTIVEAMTVKTAETMTITIKSRMNREMMSES